MTKLTRESLELIIENIIDTIEIIEDRDKQFEMIQTILESEGLIEVIEG